MNRNSIIIFLNGPINAGKSTVAKLLAKELPEAALLEIDRLREMIDWVPIDRAVPINLENAISVIRNFSKHGLNVIVPYPLSEKNYDYMTDRLKDLKVKIHVFTLAPSLQKALSDRGARTLDDEEKSRIRYHYDIGIHNPSFGEIIDNSKQTPKETRDYILGKIK